MANSNVTPSLPLLGKQVELLERSGGHTYRVSGVVRAVLVSAPGSGVSESLLIGEDFHDLDQCEVVSIA